MKTLPTETMQDSTRAADLEQVIEDQSQLVDYFESGCKPPARFRLGLEQEMFVRRRDGHRPVAYEGAEPGIRALLEGMTRFGWRPVSENGLPIALAKGPLVIALEPGGQVEFAGAPLDNAHDLEAESREVFRQLAAVADELGQGFLSIGHEPGWPRRELPWMPKERYRIMRETMPKHGSLGLAMMKSTCALQLSTDYSSEADMVKKLRVGLALQPLVTALFANSPFVEGRPSGFLSYRSHAWTDTDADRCGNLPFAFEDGMGFERYADFALDVPMYFVIRDGLHLDASGLSFRDFLAGKLAILPGERPRLSDWENHLVTLFPEVRLKQVLELRGADAGGSVSRGVALAALWAGLLYDAKSLDAAWEKAREWTAEERAHLFREVPMRGFATPFRDGTVRELCLWLLDLSRKGLRRRNRLDAAGLDEGLYLDSLQEAADRGETFAETLVRRFETEWRQDMDVAMETLTEETMA